MYKCYKSKVEDVDDKGRVVVAANALGNEDSDGDISNEGSYQKTIKENFNRVRWFLNHDKNILLGVPIEAAEVYPHLKVTGQLNLEKEVSRDIYSDYKLWAEYGKTLEHSVGVNPVKRDSKDRRRVLEWKWWEYSTLTNWGANDQTPMLGIKNHKDLLDAIDWDELRLKKGNYTDEKCIAIEKQLQILRSLVDEPSCDTRLIEPGVKGAEIEIIQPNEVNEALVQRLKSINKLFNKN